MPPLNAHFDGHFILLDEPATLKPNAKMTVIVLNADDGSLVEACSRLSEPLFQTIWDNPLDAEYDW